MKEHEFINESNSLITKFKNNEFIEFFESNYDKFPISNLTPLYRNACKCGNVIVVDYFLNTNLSFHMDINFLYVEAQHPPNDYDIPNGAIFLAGDNHHIDLLEYFIKNETYDIDSETINGLEKYMSSVLEIIAKIEDKLYMQEKFPHKTTLTISNKGKI